MRDSDAADEATDLEALFERFAQERRGVERAMEGLFRKSDLQSVAVERALEALRPDPSLLRIADAAKAEFERSARPAMRALEALQAQGSRFRDLSRQALRGVAEVPAPPARRTVDVDGLILDVPATTQKLEVVIHRICPECEARADEYDGDPVQGFRPDHLDD